MVISQYTMASNEEGAGTTVRRMRVASTVHEHFTLVDIEGKGKGSVCKACGRTLSGKNPTNLTSHLKTHHKELYDDVQSKYDL